MWKNVVRNNNLNQTFLPIPTHSPPSPLHCSLRPSSSLFSLFDMSSASSTTATTPPSPAMTSLRSISDVISTLRTSFRDADYRSAEQELRLREANLRREKQELDSKWRSRFETLESQHRESSLKVLELTEERRRLSRECQVNDDRAAAMAGELAVSREREERAIRRYDKLVGEVKVMEMKSCKDEVVELREKLREMKEVERETDERIVEVLRRNEELEVAKTEAEKAVQGMRKRIECLEAEGEVEELRRMVREREEEIGELMRKVKGLEVGMESLGENLREVVRKNGALERGKKESEAEVERMRKSVESLEADVRARLRTLREVEKEKDERVKGILEKYKVLEMEKRKAEDELEGYRKKGECLEEARRMGRGKDERIKELVEKVGCLETENKELLKLRQGLEMENMELSRQIEGLELENEQLGKVNEGLESEKMEAIVKMELVEEQFSKLEEDVASLMCSDEKLTGSQIEKILSGFICAIDSQGVVAASNALTDKDGSFHEEDSVGSHINARQSPDMNSAVRTLVLETELSTETGAISIKKDPHCGDFIVLSDSDSDNETPKTAAEVKRKRAHAESSYQRNNDANVSVDCLKSTYKVRRLVDLPHELEAAETSRMDHKFVTPQRQTMLTVRKCNEMLGGEVKSQDKNDRSTEAVHLSSQAEELIASCRRIRT